MFYVLAATVLHLFASICVPGPGLSSVASQTQLAALVSPLSDCIYHSPRPSSHPITATAIQFGEGILVVIKRIVYHRKERGCGLLPALPIGAQSLPSASFYPPLEMCATRANQQVLARPPSATFETSIRPVSLSRQLPTLTPSVRAAAPGEPVMLLGLSEWLVDHRNQLINHDHNS